MGKEPPGLKTIPKKMKQLILFSARNSISIEKEQTGGGGSNMVKAAAVKYVWKVACYAARAATL